MDGPAATALEESGGDALLGPGEITATGGDDDDGAMNNNRRCNRPARGNAAAWATAAEDKLMATEQTNGASCQRISLPPAMGSWPLAQSLFYQYKRTIERAGWLRGKRSAQNAATPDGPSSLITNAARFAPNRPAPSSRARKAGASPQHPAGWPMHATAQPWHAEGRLSPTGALRRLLSPRERRGTPPAERPGGCRGSSPGPPWWPAPCRPAPCAPARRWRAPAPSHQS